jgi:hypothetical protein
MKKNKVEQSLELIDINEANIEIDSNVIDNIVTQINRLKRQKRLINYRSTTIAEENIVIILMPVKTLKQYKKCLK